MEFVYCSIYYVSKVYKFIQLLYESGAIIQIPVLFWSIAWMSDL